MFNSVYFSAQTRNIFTYTALGLFTSASLIGCNDKPPAPAKAPTTPKETPKTAIPAVKSAKTSVDRSKLGVFSALPAEMKDAKYPSSPEKVALGQQLFFDKRLSKNHDISCNSCHGVTTYGVDNQPTSLGHKGQRGGRNAPTVMNAALHLAQFWDGREPDVEAQAKGPVMNPVEMAMPDVKRVEATLNSMPEYVAAFKKAFPDDKSPVSFDNMALAIGAYERKLVTPSAFDAFLKGDDKAMNDAQKEGLNTFLAVGCQACHSGVGVGGGMYQKLGLVKEWPNKDDLGRFALSKKDNDKFFFKVPSLRNIEKTGPYFHDGKVTSLEGAVKLMGEYQLGKILSDKEVKSILTFLTALTGTPAPEWMKEPTLPKSTKSTPKADPS